MRKKSKRLVTCPIKKIVKAWFFSYGENKWPSLWTKYVQKRRIWKVGADWQRKMMNGKVERPKASVWECKDSSFRVVNKNSPKDSMKSRLISKKFANLDTSHKNTRQQNPWSLSSLKTKLTNASASSRLKKHQNCISSTNTQWSTLNTKNQTKNLCTLWICTTWSHQLGLRLSWSPKSWCSCLSYSMKIWNTGKCLSCSLSILLLMCWSLFRLISLSVNSISGNFGSVWFRVNNGFYQD